MQEPFSAYSGDDDFVFVCYSHHDKKLVNTDILFAQQNGVNLWFDQKIAAGSAWRAEIASAIKRSQKFLFFISNSSLQSSHCLRELDFALNNNVDIIPIYLDTIDLPEELQLSLNRIQAIYRNSEIDYAERLLVALQDRRKIDILLQQKQKASVLPKKYWFMASATIALISISFLFINHYQKNIWDLQSIDGVEQNVDTSSAKYIQANNYLKRWDKPDFLSEAIKLLREVVSQDQDFALAFSRLAEALRIRYTLTRDTRWIEEAQINADKALSISQNLAPVHISLSRVNLTRGQIDLAYTSAMKALSLDPLSPEANQAMALTLQQQSKFEKADEYFDKAISLAPDNLVILDSYANFLFDQGKLGKAAALWQVVIELAPDHYAALINNGSALSSLGKYKDAIEIYLKALEIRPSYMAFANLGVAYSQSGQDDLAIEAYRTALMINDSDWLVWGNLGLLLADLKKDNNEAVLAIQKAIDLAELARQEDPRDIWAHSDLALYYAHNQEHELAEKRINTALALAPTLGEVNIIAAQVYEKLGDMNKASAYIQDAIKYDYPLQQIEEINSLKNLLLMIE